MSVDDHAIEQALARGRWAFPDGGPACLYARIPREVQAMTAELVRLWQATHWGGRHGSADTVYQEEVRRE